MCGQRRCHCLLQIRQNLFAGGDNASKSGQSRKIFALGRIYLFGAAGLTKDKEQAIEWFTKSANDGNEYARAMLDNISKFENDLLANTIFSLFVSLSRCIQDSYDNDRKDLQSIVDRKLMRVIRKKEMKLGEKEENHMDIQ